MSEASKGIKDYWMKIYQWTSWLASPNSLRSLIQMMFILFLFGWALDTLHLQKRWRCLSITQLDWTILIEASGGWSVSLYVQLHPAVTSSQLSSQLEMRVRVANASVALVVTDNIFNQRFCLGWYMMLILSGSNSCLCPYSPIKFYSCSSAFPHEV